MARFDQLVADVRSSMPEAPEPEIERYARRVVVEFCRTSRVWRERVSVPLASGQADYPVPIRDGHLEQVLKAVLVGPRGKRTLRQVQTGDALVNDLSDRPGDPRYVAQIVGGVHLLPAPDSNDWQLDVLVVAVPTRNAQQFPDFIFDGWYEGLISGVIYRLASLPSKPWSNPELAALHRHQFYRATTNARQSAEAGGRPIVRERPPRF